MYSEKSVRQRFKPKESLSEECRLQKRGYSQMIIRENANIPNMLTILRMAFIGGFLTAHFYAESRYKTAIVLFAFAGFTDFLDGFAARRLGQITIMGTILDPIADKMMIISALLCLSCTGGVPMWVPGAVIIKEAYMIAGGAMLYKRKVVISSDIWGKSATFLFAIAFLLAYPWHEYQLVLHVGRALVCVSALMSVMSAVHYTVCAVKKSDGWKTH